MNTIVLSKKQSFRYIGVIIGLFFMILSIRVYVNNYLTIEDSIKQAQQGIIHTQSETDFIRNFELPYLQTDLAQQNLVHQHQIINQGGKLIIFTRQTTQQSQEQKRISSGGESLLHQGWVNFIIYQRRRSTQK